MTPIKLLSMFLIKWIHVPFVLIVDQLDLTKSSKVSIIYVIVFFERVIYVIVNKQNVFLCVCNHVT